MISQTRIRAAQAAPDRWARIHAMAEVMREMTDAHGACTTGHLRAAGFTEGEIFGLADEARAILSGRPGAGKDPKPPAKTEGQRLAERAIRLRRRNTKRNAA